ncbi:MAG: WD40 repeat domain-containing serine/threonine protein kinase, partial [Planctomycetota bacterium]
MPTPKDIFTEALDLEPIGRGPFLDEACGDDRDLRSRVEELLAAHDAAGAFMAAPTSDQAVTPTVGASLGSIVEGPGTVIGDYRLLEVIGEGGFGKVFLAEQMQPIVRRVALKILKPGMDSEHVIARFEAERQALARMDHPGIASVFGAGATTTGRPYVVMEYVDGLPITEYCDRHRFEINDRLRLLERTCLAVQHAHQKGIVHRDLKPTNILVTVHDGVPVPKIIDFGIAKAISEPLTDRTLQTGDRQLLGTPQYMSPEQAEFGRADIDTRSDIYALGVVLYELLAGVTPFEPERMRGGSLGDIQDIICNERPPRPSTRLGAMGDEAIPVARIRGVDAIVLRRMLRGDLDWVVLKALEKEPTRRYASASDLAMEIRRVLNSEPITARSPSSLYLLRKFVGRHRVMATAAGLATLAVVGGLVMATIGLQQASTQRDRAREALDVAEDRLWESYLAQARAGRTSDEPGRRFRSLDVLRRAAEIRTSIELRNEAIACMTLNDVHVIDRFTGLPGGTAMGLRRIDRVVYRSGPNEMAVDRLDGTRLQRFDAPTGSTACLFSPDGDYVLARFDPGGPLVVWDVASGEQIIELERQQVLNLGAFDTASPPRWVAIPRRDEMLDIHALPGGAYVRSIGGGMARHALAVDPTGTRVAAGFLEQGLVSIFDLESGEQVEDFELERGVFDLDWSDDGRLVAAAGSDMHVHLFDPEAGTPVAALGGHGGAVVRVDFATGSRVLASYGWDNTTRLWDVRRLEPIVGSIRGQWLSVMADRMLTWRDDLKSLWEYEDGSEFVEFAARGAFGAPRAIGFLPDGAWLVSAGSNGVLLWDAASGVPVATLTEERGRAVAALADGRTIVGVTDEAALAWTVELTSTGSPIVTSERVLAEMPSMKSMRLSQDGTAAVVESRDEIRVIDIESGATRHSLDGYAGLDTPPSLSRDGRWLATGNWSGGPARVRDVRTGETVMEIAAPHVAVCFGGEPEMLIIGLGHEYRAIEPDTWKPRFTHARNNADNLAGPIDFAPGGHTVALTRSRYEIDLLDLQTGRVLATFESPSARAIGDLAFASDGDRIAA